MHRLALTDEDKQARDLFVQWLKELGLEITVDEMGNIFGKRKGRSPQLAMVLSGSHLDTQPKGGRFDGILGVTGALEALRTIHENRIDTERSIAIVDWTDEEGTRFAPAMLGSGVWAGHFDRDWAYARADLREKTSERHWKRSGTREKRRRGNRLSMPTMNFILNKGRFWKRWVNESDCPKEFSELPGSMFM